MIPRLELPQGNLADGHCPMIAVRAKLSLWRGGLL